MPRTRKSGKNGKRNYKRKKYQMKVPNGLPLQRTAHMTYNDTISLSGTAGLLSTYVYRANNIYDPDQVSIGHQPFSYDQWGTLYNHWIVKGAKMTLRVMNATNDTATEEPTILGVYLTDSLTPPYATHSAYIESNRGQWRIIQQDGKYPTMTCKFSPKKFFNIEDIKDNLQRYGGNTTGAVVPLDGAYFTIWGQGFDAFNVLLNVTIEYIVEWSEPRDLSQS